MRLDAELVTDLDEALQNEVIEKLKLFIEAEQPHVVIFEDYNKGVLTEPLIAAAIKLCKEKNVITTVDPKRKNFFAYKGATIFKPNFKEAREALNLLNEEISEDLLNNIHLQLEQSLKHGISLITLSEKGMFYESAAGSKIIPTHIRNIADVSGAGDTVIAVASLVYAATKDIHLAAEMANLAGGIVCEEVGTVAINKEKLLQECNSVLNVSR
jgi:rfaE bifunctional protein kinase chain/domain